MNSQPVGAEECSAFGSPPSAVTAYPNRAANLGALRISRALPIRDRRLVGPWCFLDRFGPLSFGGERSLAAERPMNVPPHPHIGLQTVSWLLEGEVLHSDSLGYEAVVRPGGVNVMTAGRGIAHAEETPLVNSARLSGIQLWVALPEAHRNVAPSFVHVERTPFIEERDGTVQVFAGSYGRATSPAPYFSDIVGLDVQVDAGGELELALQAEFEHAVLVLGGDCRLADDRPLGEHTLYYLGTGRSALTFHSRGGSRLLLIGGPPFPEKILMWWNFVARTPEEITEARADWEAGRRFGTVHGEHGPRLPAPDLVRFARPNPMS